ncbi:uncharacterized protein LOC129913729 isoform X2 [Episyrphus balteatus]|uniref:uncharacterized protein LOC129913729 isoform X2 n=1 Tax=Episyrphus balteatus TaxID=286459 RepID=UPI0024860C5C|nr:uncharacterized protein LOC129913729 isoform X2 [Episyrphus balteatus]
MEEKCSYNSPNGENNKVEKNHPSSKLSKITINQTPTNNTIKYKALQEIKEKIEKAHGINLNCSQIRKKLENMKMRAKLKRDRIHLGDLETRFKSFEEELLKLMDYKKYPLTNKFITDTEQCDASADSSLYLKYEAEDEMSQEDEPSKQQQILPSNIIPGFEIKSETNEEETLHFDNEQIQQLHSKDTDSFVSEDDHHHNTIFEEKPSTKLGFGLKEKDFFDIIKTHDCLFDKSKAPHMKEIKQDALQDVQEKLKTIYGINLNSLQIRKKIDNMKGRVKGKFDKWKTRIAPGYKLKTHERQLLNLMKSKKLLEPELCAELVTSEDSNVAEEEEVSGKTNCMTSNNFQNLLNSESRHNEFEQMSLITLQKEVLLEQKDLNRQQNELNNLQKEILALKKEKLLLELDILKKK